MRIERLARDTGLDHAIHILGMDRENGVHLLEIEGNAARWRIHMPLQRTARTKGDHRHTVLGADAHDRLHLFGGGGTDHRIRGLVAQPCGCMRVLFAQSLTRLQPGTEPLAPHLYRGCDAGFVACQNFG